jgi:hypothetical protein
MHVGRLYDALVSVSEEFERLDTAGRLRQLSARIQGLMPNSHDSISQSRDAEGYRDYWRSLRDDLELCP